MAPKKQKQSLADFLADETTGKVDWADDFDDLPAAPLPRTERGPPQRGADWLSSMPDRADRDRSIGGPGGGAERHSYPAREELPLPTQPPYTAFIGNLSFEVTESDISDFFAPSQTTSIRLVTGGDGRPKGFGYVEFETLDGLKDALSRSGSQLAGRTARVSVAEPRDAKAPALSSVAEEATQWRRAGPLPPSEGPSGGRRGGDRPSYNRFESSGGSSGFDNMDVGPGGRSGFGSRFAPSAPREPREPRRAAEPTEPSQGDNASDWRTGKPVSEVATPAHPSRRPSASPAVAGGEGGRAPSFRRHGDATEVDDKFASQERLGFGSKFVATPPESPSVSKQRGYGFDRKKETASANTAGDSADTWRSARRNTGQSGGANGTTPNANGVEHSANANAGEPVQRKKLELKPRTAPVGDNAAAAQSSDKANNPFGNARPVDASERQREIEAKMAQREKERKEEDRQRREKQKVEREKTLENAPTGPKADRRKGNGTSGSARASPAAAEKTVNGDGAAKSITTSPSAPKQPTPTGAWGGGRKPSGALAGKQDEETEQDAAKPAVDDVTAKVEAVTVKDA